MYGYQDSHFDDCRSYLRSMWTLNKFYFALTIFAVIYSLVTFIQSMRTEGRCDVITTNQEVDNILWLLANINYLLLWQYRMMYVFWPKKTEKKPEPPVRQSVVFTENSAS